MNYRRALPAQTIQWLTTVAPDLVFGGDGPPDLMFGHTGGWQWEEGTFVGEQLVGGDTRLSVTQRLLPTRADFTVFSSENTAREVLAVNEALVASNRPSFQMGKLAMRCVGAPGDNEIWNWHAERVKHFAGLSTIGEDEARRLHTWAASHGYRGAPIHVCPLGARQCVGVQVDGVLVPRRGFVYLGSCVPEKQVEMLLEAVNLAKVPFTFALALAVPGGEENAGSLITRVRQDGNPNVRITSVGVHGRQQLLATSLGAVTMSRADSQWLPGTEARACGGIALAHADGNIKVSNGDGIMYTPLNDVEAMAFAMRQLSTIPDLYRAEQERQQVGFSSRYSSVAVGQSILQWLRSL